MSVPHPEGRVQPRRNVLRSVQARAAVESVLVPVCGRNLAFPVRREIPAEVRRLWHERLRALRAAGWDKVRPHYRLGIVEKCPWGLLGLDDHARGKKARRCQLLACPACHAHKSALLAESIVRCLRKNPDANLRLLRRTRIVPLVDLPSAVRAAKQNPDPGADGYFREITVEAVSLNQVRVRVAHLLINPSRPKRGKKVRATYIGVVKLVARMRPYAASNLWCEWDQDGVCQAGLLNLLGGVWLSSRAGVARTKGGAARSAGFRTILGSLWIAILVGSVVGLSFPVPMAPLLIVQVVYKTLWLLVYALPRALGGRSGEVPWGISLTFLVIVLTYPWVIPWAQVFAR